MKQHHVLKEGLLKSCPPRVLYYMQEFFLSARRTSGVLKRMNFSIFILMCIIEGLIQKGQVPVENNEQYAAGLGFIESFEVRYPTRTLETLLCDRTTGRNIIWADNEYEALGEGYMGEVRERKSIRSSPSILYTKSQSGLMWHSRKPTRLPPRSWS